MQEFFDAIIIGAGINGCGIALELTRRRQKVLVLERKAIGSGTSSHSSRLIHGGLRYLETAHFKLVRESLRDREELLETYPDLVSLKPFYLPVYKDSPRPAWMIWLGLKAYDLLAGKFAGDNSAVIPRREFAGHAPEFIQDNLRAVFRYFDAKTDDLALTRRIARDARQDGCRFHEHITVETITPAAKQYQVVTSRGTFNSHLLVNASGPWIDEVNRQYHLPARYHIRKISGIHIVIDGCLTTDLMFMQTKGKRIFFIIPEPDLDRTIIGTTEREEFRNCDEVTVDDRDVLYLLENINKYLIPEHQLSLNDIRDVWIGIRPLIAKKDHPTDLSREYVLDLQHANGRKLLHVFGGKLTTFLSLARKSAEKLEIPDI